MDSFKREIEGGEVMLVVVMEDDDREQRKFEEAGQTRQTRERRVQKRDASLRNWGSKESLARVQLAPQNSVVPVFPLREPWLSSPVSTTALHTQ